MNLRSNTSTVVSSMSACAFVIASLAMPNAAQAQNAPPSHVASPGVYKIIAENEKYRVILATWKPGQRDEWHSHPAGANYAVNDCGTHRVHTPDGKFADISKKAGDARMMGAIPSHAVENTGTTECIQVIFEPK